MDSGPVTHLPSMLCILMKILSHASVKKKSKRLNPFTASACKLSGLKVHGHPANSLFSGSISHLLSLLCVLIKILSHSSAKKKTEKLKGFDFRTFSWSCSSDITAVKGLKKGLRASDFELLVVSFRRHHSSEGVKKGRISGSRQNTQCYNYILTHPKR